MVDQLKGKQTFSETDQFLFQACDQHDSYMYQVFTKDQSQSNPLLCMKCIISKKQSPSNLILLQEVLQNLDQNIVENWPPLNNNEQIQKKILEVKQQCNYVEDYADQILSFFDNFEKEIHIKIELIKKDLLQKCNIFHSNFDNIIKSYNEIADIEKLKEIISALMQKNNQSDIIDKLKSLIKEKVEKTELNTQLLTEQLSKINIIFDQEMPSIIKGQVLDTIEQITFFKALEDNANKESLDRNSSNKCDILMKLISNKSNNLNLQFLKEIKCALKQSSVMINTVNFENIYQDNVQGIDFDWFTLDMIQDFKLLADTKKTVEDYYNQYDPEDDQIQIQQRAQSLSYVLNEYISNHTQNNLLIEQFKLLIRKYPIFEIQKYKHPLLIIQTDYQQSKINTLVSKTHYGDVYLEKIQEQGFVSLYLDQQIKKDQKYVIRLELDCSANSLHTFCLGIIPYNSLNSMWCNNILYLKFSNLCKKGNWNCIRGNPLWQEGVRQQQQKIEIRISISERIFQCLSYPDYHHINQFCPHDNVFLLTQEQLDKQFLAFQLTEIRDKITITHFSVVDSFSQV